MESVLLSLKLVLLVLIRVVPNLVPLWLLATVLVAVGVVWVYLLLQRLPYYRCVPCWPLPPPGAVHSLRAGSLDCPAGSINTCCALNVA